MPLTKINVKIKKTYLVEAAVRLCAPLLDLEIFLSSNAIGLGAQTHMPSPPPPGTHIHKDTLPSLPPPCTTVCDVANTYLFGRAAGPCRLWPRPLGSLPYPSPPAAPVLISERQGKKHLEPTAEPKSILVQRNALRHHAADRLQAGWRSGGQPPTDPTPRGLSSSSCPWLESSTPSGCLALATAVGTPPSPWRPLWVPNKPLSTGYLCRSLKDGIDSARLRTNSGNCVLGSMNGNTFPLHPPLSQKPDSSLQFPLQEQSAPAPPTHHHPCGDRLTGLHSLSGPAMWTPPWRYACSEIHIWACRHNPIPVLQ